MKENIIRKKTCDDQETNSHSKSLVIVFPQS